MDIADILLLKCEMFASQVFFADRGALRVFNICGLYKAEENRSNQESELLAEV